MIKLGTLEYDLETWNWTLKERHSPYNTRVYMPYDENQRFCPQAEGSEAIAALCPDNGCYYVININYQGSEAT